MNTSPNKIHDAGNTRASSLPPFFPLSVNGVGGVAWGDVASLNSNPFAPLRFPFRRDAGPGPGDKWRPARTGLIAIAVMYLLGALPLARAPLEHPVAFLNLNPPGPDPLSQPPAVVVHMLTAMNCRLIAAKPV